LWLSIRCYVFD